MSWSIISVCGWWRNVDRWVGCYCLCRDHSGGTTSIEKVATYLEIANFSGEKCSYDVLSKIKTSVSWLIPWKYRPTICILDRIVTWSEHTTKRRLICYRAFVRRMNIRYRSLGTDFESLRIIYIALIKLKIGYGSSLFSSAAPNFLLPLPHICKCWTEFNIGPVELFYALFVTYHLTLLKLKPK